MAILTPHDTIVVRLPYPVKIMGITFQIKRKTGFSFANMAFYLFRDAKGIKNSKDLTKWIEDNGGNMAFVNEMIYYSTMAYCQLNLKKHTINKEKLQQAILLSDKATQDSIMQCWNKSDIFGQSVKKKQQGKPI